MSNYSKLTDFAAKDSLPSGTPAKVVKGVEIDDEFQAIETAIATKANTTDIGVTIQAYDATLAKYNVANAWSKAQQGKTQTASVTGNTTLDFGTYQNFVLTLTGALTLDNPATEVVGQSGFIVFTQDATGGRTVSLGTEYKTANGSGITLSTAANSVDVVPYIVSASGSILLGAPQKAFA